MGILRKRLKLTGADRGTDGETADNDSARVQFKTEIGHSDILVSVFCSSIYSFLYAHSGRDCVFWVQTTKPTSLFQQPVRRLKRMMGNKYHNELYLWTWL